MSCHATAALQQHFLPTTTGSVKGSPHSTTQHHSTTRCTVPCLKQQSGAQLLPRSQTHQPIGTRTTKHEAPTHPLWYERHTPCSPCLACPVCHSNIHAGPCKGPGMLVKSARNANQPEMRTEVQCTQLRYDLNLSVHTLLHPSHSSIICTAKGTRRFVQLCRKKSRNACRHMHTYHPSSMHAHRPHAADHLHNPSNQTTAIPSTVSLPANARSKHMRKCRCSKLAKSSVEQGNLQRHKPHAEQVCSMTAH
jgi:hypothetical protein